MRFLLLALLALSMPVVAFSQASFPAKSVCDVRTDANADCSADAIGDTVCVQGVVIAWKEFGVRGAGAIYDPVSGCCMSIFDITNAPNLAPGTLVEVCGWVGSFHGLAEIVDDPANFAIDPVVTVLDPGPIAFPTTPISAADIAAGSPTGETLESCAVSICGSFTNTGLFNTFSSNYVFVDANGDSCTVRIDSDTGIGGTAIPVGSVTVTGVLGQFDTVAGCDGYQVLPRGTADLVPGQCTVAVKESTWGELKETYREE